MFMKLRIVMIILSLLFLTCMDSCKKFVALPPPSTQLSTASIFASDASATSFLMGTYSLAMDNTGLILNGGSLFASLSADELTTTGQIAAENDFADNSLHSDNPNVAKI